jgi:hypothetical protein
MIPITLAYLKERTIQRLRIHANFDMAIFRPVDHCGSACCLVGNIIYAAGLDIWSHHIDHLEPLARWLWAEAYGDKEAIRLRFYGRDWGSLNLVQPEEVIAHLEGEHPKNFHHLMSIDDDFSEKLAKQSLERYRWILEGKIRDGLQRNRINDG